MMTLEDCLQLQLAEVEMLCSMYPKEEEFRLISPSVIAQFNNFLEGNVRQLSERLEFIMHLDIEEFGDTLEVNVNLPHLYPNVLPEVHIRSAKLLREDQRRFNECVVEFLSTQQKGELLVMMLIDWTNENAPRFYKEQEPTTAISLPEDKKDGFSRLWIYSHHIYNKEKRRAILQDSKDLGLTGFCLPGKPGVICVEGYTKDCEDFLQSVRLMSWKKLSLIKKETTDDLGPEIETLRKFEDFQEINMNVRKGPAREYHMDMGEFQKYLKSHQCEDIFPLIFGVGGQN